MAGLFHFLSLSPLARFDFSYPESKEVWKHLETASVPPSSITHATVCGKPYIIDETLLELRSVVDPREVIHFSSAEEMREYLESL